MPFVPATFNPALAHISDEAGNIFQVLNEEGDAWDELATQEQIRNFNGKDDTIQQLSKEKPNDPR